MRWLAGWRLALRMARREALRAKGRSILVLVMIALPVMGVTAADILIRTSQISAVEGVDRYLGTTAAARVAVVTGQVEQSDVNPFGGSVAYSGSSRDKAPTRKDVLSVLGTGRPTSPLNAGYLTVNTTDGRATASGYELEPTDPLASGLMRLTSGRWPQKAGEVVVNAYLAGQGPGLGSQLVMHGGGRHKATATVVGIAESPIERTQAVVSGLPGSLAFEWVDRGWLIGGGDVTWSQVLGLNRIGGMALSRYAVHHPPDLSAYQSDNGPQAAVIAIALLIVVMALIEVVLLAGPAFAVGAKRQARALALMAASGGTPPQARRVVLASGVVLGLLGAVIGVGLGIPVARLFEPLVQRFSDTWLGPFEIRWHEVLGVAAFGLLSALIAAVVPAWIASRQDVVAVLSGRRGDRRPSVKNPILGIVLLGAGVLAAAVGTRGASSTGAVFIAASAVICVLGMILLVPIVVVAVARLGARLPLPLRFAVRDASRHRTRTVPAVAAVAATVAAVVTLGIAVTSDDAQNRATYEPALPLGQASVHTDGKRNDWSADEDVIRARLDNPTVIRQEAVLVGSPARGTWLRSVFRTPQGRIPELGGWGGSCAQGQCSDLELSDGTGLSLPDVVDDASADAARAVLAKGGVLVFTEEPVDATTAKVTLHSGRRTYGPVTVPAAYVDVTGAPPPGRGIISPRVADELGVHGAVAGLQISGTTITADQEQALTEALAALPGEPTLYVERGYRSDSAVRILEIVLAGLGGLLMLGGTLTATYLSLADARPDLATLAAIGAEPRTRRLVAAAYALAVGLLGALLGAVVGLVPGIAITYPITGSRWSPSGTSGITHYVDVPWTLIGVVVLGLPILVAGLVALTTRSRLPMVARLS